MCKLLVINKATGEQRELPLKEFPMTTCGKVKEVDLRKRGRKIFNQPEEKGSIS